MFKILFQYIKRKVTQMDDRYVHSVIIDPVATELMVRVRTPVEIRPASYFVDAEKAGLKRQVGGTPAKKCPRLGCGKRAKNARPTPATCQSSSRPRSKAH